MNTFTTAEVVYGRRDGIQNRNDGTGTGVASPGTSSYYKNRWESFPASFMRRFTLLNSVLKKILTGIIYIVQNIIAIMSNSQAAFFEDLTYSMKPIWILINYTINGFNFHAHARQLGCGHCVAAENRALHFRPCVNNGNE